MSFDTWWLIWPVGKKKGKDRARSAYFRRVKSIERERPDDDPHELLSNGLREYLMSKTVADGFVMLPSTWLNGGHWQDDPDRAEKFEEPESKAKRVSRMDETTRQEMARARRIKEERSASPFADDPNEFRVAECPDSTDCPTCGAEMFFGRVTNRWQCTTRACFQRMTA